VELNADAKGSKITNADGTSTTAGAGVDGERGVCIVKTKCEGILEPYTVYKLSQNSCTYDFPMGKNIKRRTMSTNYEFTASANSLPNSLPNMRTNSVLNPLPRQPCRL